MGYTAGHTPSITDIRQLLELGGVPVRSPLGYKWPVMGLMFPLTPIELHNGWVLAEERLITARSGTFGWDNKTDATLYKFDSTGKIAEEKNVVVTTSGIQVKVPEDGLVIVVRDN